MSQGESVVTIVDLAYTVAGSRPAFSRQSVSPCRIALPSCTRLFQPVASTPPSTTSAAPIGMPPSDNPCLAARTAAARYIASGDSAALTGTSGLKR